MINDAIKEISSVINSEMDAKEKRRSINNSIDNTIQLLHNLVNEDNAKNIEATLKRLKVYQLPCLEQADLLRNYKKTIRDVEFEVNKIFKKIVTQSSDEDAKKFKQIFNQANIYHELIRQSFDEILMTTVGNRDDRVKSENIQSEVDQLIKIIENTSLLGKVKRELVANLQTIKNIHVAATDSLRSRVASVMNTIYEHIPDQQEQPTPTKRRAPEQATAANLLRRCASKLIQMRGHNAYRQLEVIDQRQINGGGVFCGHNALKNALIALGIANSLPGITPALFQDKKIYQSFADIIKTTQTPQNGVYTDLTLQAMNDVLHQFIAEEKIDHPLAGVLRTYKDSFSVVSFQEFERIITSGDSLKVYSNLRNVAKKPGPFTHAFAIGMGEPGSPGHWTALILEKDRDGNHIWYGCDPWGNQTAVLPHAVDYLESLLKNSLGDKHSIEMYTKFTAAAFHTRTWFEDSGGIPAIKKEKEEKLIRQYEFEMFLHCYQFMSDMGWLTSAHPAIVKEKQYLHALSRNFLKYPDSHPEHMGELRSIERALRMQS